MADLLVVDDDPDAAGALAEAMLNEGHCVRVAYDGREGLGLATERMPDAVLLDVDMPVLDGPGLAWRMLVHNCGLEKVPVVLLSGVPELAEIARQVGTPYFLGKPYWYEDLVALVDRSLAERTAPTPSRAPGSNPCLSPPHT